MTKSMVTYAVDAIAIIDEIGSFTTGMDSSSFDEQRVTRLAVERLLISLGEALQGMRRLDPSAASTIPDLARAIGLRHILAHNYEGLMSDRVWSAVESLPNLRGELQDIVSANPDPNLP